MPGLSGIDVAKRAREVQPAAAIIILTGHGSLERAVEGIHVGVFDYLLKTASPQAMLARVAVALEAQAEARRTQRVMTAIQGVVTDLAGVDQRPPVTEPWLEVGDLQISTWNQTVRRGAHTLPLTPTEFRMLETLAANPNQVFTRMQLIDRVHGHAFEGYERTVDAHVKNLRGKVEPDPRTPRYIVTVYGVGYKFQVADAPHG